MAPCERYEVARRTPALRVGVTPVNVGVAAYLLVKWRQQHREGKAAG